MHIRKVDSDVIKRYESSQVKFKTTGTIWEVQFSAGVNKSCAVRNISKDTYPGKTAGNELDAPLRDDFTTGATETLSNIVLSDITTDKTCQRLIM